MSDTKMLIVPKVRKYMSDSRYRKTRNYIIGRCLDVGSEWYRKGLVCCDKKPNDKRIKKEDALKLSYKDNSFDTVCCLETLEHTLNPVNAMLELKRVAKKRIIICIPLEPYFTIPRLLLLKGWNPEHLWAITPAILKHYFGKPVHECQFKFRWYFAVWDIK